MDALEVQSCQSRNGSTNLLAGRVAGSASGASAVQAEKACAGRDQCGASIAQTGNKELSHLLSMASARYCYFLTVHGIIQRTRSRHTIPRLFAPFRRMLDNFRGVR